MKLFSSYIFFLLSIGGAKQANARGRRRRLNTIKGDEANASMSMSYASMSYASIVMAKGGNSKGRSKGSPTPAPTSPTPAPSHDDLCGSTITKDFVLQKDLHCECTPIDDTEFGYALKIDGRGVTLNLNGYTVSCPSGFGQNQRLSGQLCGNFGAECDSVIQVDGTANSVVGGTGKYVGVNML